MKSLFPILCPFGPPDMSILMDTTFIVIPTAISKMGQISRCLDSGGNGAGE